MPVYILKFSSPLGNARHKAWFYIGYAPHGKVHQRVADHQAGRGAAITRAAVQRGITIEHILTLPGGRTEERRYKRQKNTRRLVIKHLGFDPEILPL